MSIVLIETAGIRVKGLKGWLKSFTEPIAIVTPINIMEYLSNRCRCVCDCSETCWRVRHHELIEYILPVGFGIVQAYFDIFDGLIQRMYLSF